MKRFLEVIEDPKTGWNNDGYSPVLYLPGNSGFYEVRLEPLSFGQYYLAVYASEPGGLPELVGEKVPIRPGGGKEPT